MIIELAIRPHLFSDEIINHFAPMIDNLTIAYPNISNHGLTLIQNRLGKQMYFTMVSKLDERLEDKISRKIELFEKHHRDGFGLGITFMKDDYKFSQKIKLYIDHVNKMIEEYNQVIEEKQNQPEQQKDHLYQKLNSDFCEFTIHFAPIPYIKSSV